MRNDLALVVLLISILALMILPLPSGLIDILLAVNISLSITLLMVAVYLKRPSDFSTFPAVILLATAFRLALSIATTRLILSEVDAGQIIATFGEFVIRGNVVIGLVIFLIITVVQFVVVTKGAERVAEVAARFSLDAMPGKQMSIEADIRAGTLEQEEGAQQRDDLNKESQFFGAMDGAMKFVKGDAIAGLIIIFINLLGGIAVGTSVHGLSFGDAVATYSLLTIGDGLVAQIPALLVSLCAGTIVTRVTKENSSDLGSDIARELLADVRVPAVASIVVLSFGFVPGFPLLAFALASVLLFSASLVARAALRRASETDSETAEADSQDVETDGTGNISDRIGLCLSQSASDQLDLDKIRHEIAERVAEYSNRYGINFKNPFTVTRDVYAEGPYFQVELDEIAIDAGALKAGHVVTNAGKTQLSALGIEHDATVIDWFEEQTPHFFAPQHAVDKLTHAGFSVVSIEAALAECTFRRLEKNVRVLFTRAECEDFMASARAKDDHIVDFIAEKLNGHDLIRIFRYLLEDGVPLRPTRLVIESLAHWIHMHPDADPVFFAECLRNSLKRQLCRNLANTKGELGVSMLAPALQSRILDDVKQIKSFEEGGEIASLPIQPQLSDYILAEVKRLAALDVAQNCRIAIVAVPEIRRRLRNFLAQCGINIPVISSHEISSDILPIPVDVLGEQYSQIVEPAAGR